MAILMRGGGYTDFDPSKLRPREWAVVLQDDPSARDGKAVYICFAAGNVKRISTYEDMKDDLISATDDVIEQYVQAFNEIKTEVERLKNETLGYKNTAQAKAAEAASSAQTASEKSQSASASATNSANSADSSEEYSLRSKSYAVGTDGEVRPNDGTDNSKYYKEECQRLYQNIEQLISSVTTGGLIPAGTVSFADLPLVPNLGYMYNISDDFVTDERFEDGVGKYYSSGTNVYWTVNAKWDVLTGVAVLGVKGESEALYQTGYVNVTKESIGLDKVENMTPREILEGLTATDVTNALGYIPGSEDGGVTGIKGESETDYRKGNVNIAKSDIGLGNVDNTADADKPISTAQQTELDKKADKTDIVLNSKTNDGYVLKGEGNPNKVWGTDENGNPMWIDAPKSIDSTTLSDCRNIKAISGINSVMLTWEDPGNLEFNGVVYAEWGGTKVVKNSEHYPTSPADGIELYDNKVLDSHATTPLNDTDVQQGRTYYYAFFPYTVDGKVSLSDRNRVSSTYISVDPILENNSWELISIVSRAGLAKANWNIGDTKKLKIDGQDYTVRFVGADFYDLADGSGKAGMTFLTDEIVRINRPLSKVYASTIYSTDLVSTETGRYLKEEFQNRVEPSILPYVREVNYSMTNENVYSENITRGYYSPFKFCFADNMSTGGAPAFSDRLEYFADSLGSDVLNKRKRKLIDGTSSVWCDVWGYSESRWKTINTDGYGNNEYNFSSSSEYAKSRSCIVFCI